VLPRSAGAFIREDRVSSALSRELVRAIEIGFFLVAAAGEDVSFHRDDFVLGFGGLGAFGECVRLSSNQRLAPLPSLGLGDREFVRIEQSPRLTVDRLGAFRLFLANGVNFGKFDRGRIVDLGLFVGLGGDLGFDLVDPFRLRLRLRLGLRFVDFFRFGLGWFGDHDRVGRRDAIRIRLLIHRDDQSERSGDRCEREHDGRELERDPRATRAIDFRSGIGLFPHTKASVEGRSAIQAKK
jgi:hypothetical protein